MNNPAFSRSTKRVAPKRKRGREYLTLLACALVLVTAMLMIVGKQRDFYQLGYSVVELRNENARLRESRDRLEAQLAKMTAPDRIVSESMRQGLRPADPKHCFEVRLLPPDQRQESGGPEMVAFMEVEP